MMTNINSVQMACVVESKVAIWDKKWDIIYVNKYEKTI
jgi:hypothetical protein